MALDLILIIPGVATLLTFASRRAAPWVTLAAALAVLGFAIVAALQVTDGGLIRAAAGGLTLDPLAALYLLLVAFVGVTAALYSIGYLRARHAGEEAKPHRRAPQYREPAFPAAVRNEPVQGCGMSGIRDRGARRRSQYYVEHSDRANSAQGASLGRRSRRVAGNAGSYYPLFNLFLLSMLAVPLVANIAVQWIAIELTTLFSAFLVAYENRPEALEAAWKYVALTSMGAMIALLGVLVLYYGVNAAGQSVTWPGLVAAAPKLAPAVLLFSFVLWLIGFGAKAGLVPLHTWLPDAHSQAPAPICALLSGVETTAALYMILRLYPALIRNPGLTHIDAWYLVAGLITIGAAAFLLLQVTDFKRLFAFSTVEHMGIMLTAVGLGTAASRLGAVYQIFGHSFTKSFCFYAAGLATIACGTQQIAAARGLMTRSPAASWGLLLGAVAIAGAPPFALFISEFQILRAGFGAGRYVATGLLTALIVLAFIAVLYQVGRIVFGEPDSDAPTHPLPVSSLAALGLAFAPMFVFGFYLPPPLAALIRHAAANLGGAP